MGKIGNVETAGANSQREELAPLEKIGSPYRYRHICAVSLVVRRTKLISDARYEKN